MPRDHSHPTRRKILGIAAAAALVSFSFPALAAGDADNWPAKPIRYVVPFGAGGLADSVARLIAPPLGDILGQSVVVENRAGVSGVVGTQMVAKAAPDGYTLVGGTITTHAVIPYFNKSIGYDVVKDFTPVHLVGTVTNVLVVNVDSPYKTLPDLIAALKARPGELTFGTAGPGTSQHLAGELLQSLTNTRMRQIPYKGGTQAMTDLIGGQIDMIFETSTVAKSLIDSGRVRALGSTGPDPVEGLDGVAPIAQQGIPAFDVRSWQGVFAPAGTPEPVVKKLADGIAKVLAMPEIRARMAGLGIAPSDLGPDGFARYQAQEIERWGQVIKSAGIKAD
ncbi:Bug family tripartite tricarboxylate transporter substrate binding protein [Parapusillimonas granuli]|uniref:Tripartite tricarboxylate transporter substrate binding protein n=1 Tax=Parapusillimonas granuli TaxID=380911 RepID=A0A853G4J9_9BURK|nr:tripartite tricarboxylate transporter substrate binding protein [Parapusillimonas granuli]MBB5215682.1 tripartite-type tricarboxylate transporter receptor subunit TctC [Parapusillimonas granuli]MEB2401931.1 tripartite tricarboxylate transporter substrate binding protein [Alcaligenaceae bacterium]NYT49651.1 tripartite tricarboxylate transporter substrate binding protein [Parapusillimonas granuli]